MEVKSIKIEALYYLVCRFLYHFEQAIHMQHKDKRRTVLESGQKVNFVYLDSDFVPPLEKITSVSVVPFMENGNIVTTVLRSRGIDIPRGHVLKDEKNIEETARRESYEEAFITLKDIRIATVIQSDYYGSSDDELTYMVITTAMVDKLEKFILNPEANDRKIMSTEEFLLNYTAGDIEGMRQIIMSAKKLMFEN